MHRQPLLKQLQEYELKYPEEKKKVERFNTFVTRYSNCFERSLEVAHLTASCWLWNHDQSAALFTLHKKLKKWLQLGGHADGDSNLLEVALKEAREESGIDQITPLSTEILDIDIHEIPARPNEPTHFHYDVRYMLQATEDLPFIISEESDDLKWISLEKLDSLDFEESIARMHQKVKSTSQIS